MVVDRTRSEVLIGSSDAAFLAAWTPAKRAVPRTSPFLSELAVTLETVCSSMVIRLRATARYPDRFAVGFVRSSSTTIFIKILRVVRREMSSRHLLSSDGARRKDTDRVGLGVRGHSRGHGGPTARRETR